MNRALRTLRLAALTAALKNKIYREKLRDEMGLVPNFDNTEHCLQLHERVEIIYVVDGWEASLWTNDNPGRKVLEAKGESIFEALARLERLCDGKMWLDVRKMPSIA